MAIVPVTVLLSVRGDFALQSRRAADSTAVIAGRLKLVVVALALVALVCVHTSEVVFVAFLVLLLLAQRLRRRSDVVSALVPS